MSWFGANLNQSLSSLKGQIVSLTNVLAEGEEDIAADQAEANLIQGSKDSMTQIERLQYDKADLENRLTANELESRRKIFGLENKLLSTENEYKNFKEKAKEWNWQEQHMNSIQRGHENLLVKSQPSTTEQDALLGKLQSELKQLLLKFEETDNEKNRLHTDMQELDSQHQQALDLLYTNKNKLEIELTKANEKLIKCDAEILELRSCLQNKLLTTDDLVCQEGGNLSPGISLPENMVIPEIDNSLLAKSDMVSSKIHETDINAYTINQLEIQLQEANLRIEQVSHEKMLAEENINEAQKCFNIDITKLNAQLNDTIVDNKKALQVSKRKEEFIKKCTTSINDKLEESELKVMKYEAVIEEQTREHEFLCTKYQKEINRNKDLSGELFNLKAQKMSNVQETDTTNQNANHCLQQLMKTCNLSTIDELPSAIGEKDSEIALLRCERDKLQEELDSTSHALKDTQDIVEVIESDKLDLEGECEELRDQLEELQYGKREEPEGSLSRSLPTIEEEEIEPTEEQARNKAERSDESTLKRERVSPFKSEVTFLNAKCHKLEEELTVLKSEMDYLKSERCVEESDNTTDSNTVKESPSTTHTDVEVVLSDKELTDNNLLRSQVIFKDDQIDDLRNRIFEIGELFAIKNYNVREPLCAIKRQISNYTTSLTNKDDEIKLLKQNMQYNKEDILAAKQERDYSLTQKDILQISLNDSNEENILLGQKINVMNETIENSMTGKSLQEERVTLLEQLLQDEKNKYVEYTTQENLTLAPLKREHIQLTEAHQKLSANNQLLSDTINSLKVSANENEDDKMQLIANYEISLTTRNEECFHKNKIIIELKGEIVSLKDSVSQLTSSHDQEISSYKNRTDKFEMMIYELKVENSSLVNELNSQINHLKSEAPVKLSMAMKQNEDLNAQIERVTAEQQTVLSLNLKHTETIKLKEEELLICHSELNKLTTQLTENRLELGRFDESLKNLTNHNEQLIAANSKFNSQYEVLSKEMLAGQDKERHLLMECERLKQHLVTIEESYTSEIIQGEQRESALKQTIAKLHEKMASHSNLYSSTNQKNADRVETLQDSLKSTILGRDEALLRLQLSEECSMENQESLRSLNQVLLDFQKSYNKDVREATEKDRRELEKERNQNFELGQEVNALGRKIEDLEDSSTSSQQLQNDIQSNQSTIVGLQSQVSAMQQVVKTSQDQVYLLESSSEVNVEKNLVRNLFVGYFASSADKQREVLHIIAQILDFSPDERVRTGLDTNPNSWLTSVANFLAPPPSNMRVTSKVDVLDHSSLSRAFIRFLEDESTVRPHAKLPAIEMAEEASLKALKKAQYKTNEPINEEGTTSKTFSPLIDTPLSTLQPVLLQAVDNPDTSEGSSNVSEERYLKNLLSEDKAFNS